MLSSLYMDWYPKEWPCLIWKWTLWVREETPFKITFHKPQWEDTDLWLPLGCRHWFPLVYPMRGPSCARRGVSSYSLRHKKILKVFLAYLDTFLTNPGSDKRSYQDVDCSKLSQLGATWFSKRHLAMSGKKLRRLLLVSREGNQGHHYLP